MKFGTAGIYQRSHLSENRGTVPESAKQVTLYRRLEQMVLDLLVNCTSPFSSSVIPGHGRWLPSCISNIHFFLQDCHTIPEGDTSPGQLEGESLYKLECESLPNLSYNIFSGGQGILS